MKKHLFAIAALAACGILVPTAAQAATPTVMITKVYVNSPGSDTRSKKSLDAEYIVLKNTTKKTINLSGWTVRDRSKHIYKFTSLNLGAGKSVTLHTGSGTNTSANRYWGSHNYIWNNSGDKAYLRRTTANIDTCTWKTVSSYVNC